MLLGTEAILLTIIPPPETITTNNQVGTGVEVNVGVMFTPLEVTITIIIEVASMPRRDRPIEGFIIVRVLQTGAIIMAKAHRLIIGIMGTHHDQMLDNQLVEAHHMLEEVGFNRYT